MAKIFLDWQQREGRIKPMHGVTNGPVTMNFNYDARKYFREVSIPFSRLHDTEYPFGSGEFVDISCLFKCFDADENDPRSYNFTLTDEYLKAILEAGTRVIYRLGQTIEHQASKRYIHPPRDFEKWARICEHIIRHVNEGWADGHHMGIEYWEIWNEPDLAGQCWTGTAEEYARLYRVTARHLKRCFPKIKVGGPTVTSPNNDSFLRVFFDEISRSPRVPLDFASWHSYLTDPALFVSGAEKMRKWCREYGYPAAENILDEWNYVDDWERVGDSYRTIHSPRGTAFIAATMIALQRSPLDIATYYDSQITFTESWNALFSPGNANIHGAMQSVIPQGAFEAFRAFGELYRLGEACAAQSDDPRVRVLAAADGRHGAAMAVNFDPHADKDVGVWLTGLPAGTRVECCRDNGRFAAAAPEADGSYRLPANAMLRVFAELN